MRINEYKSKHDGVLLHTYEMSIRTATCLAHLNIHSVRQLKMWSEAELLNTKNIGRKSLTEIKEILASLNLKLKEES